MNILLSSNFHGVFTEMKKCTFCKRKKNKFYSGNNVCSDCFKKRRYEHRRNNPKLVILSSAKHRAKKEGVLFDLVIEDIVLPDYCPVLGIKLKFNTGIGGARDDSPSLDRRIPSLGYVKGNISIMSFRANRIKNNATVSELENILKWLKGFK